MREMNENESFKLKIFAQIALLKITTLRWILKHHGMGVNCDVNVNSVNNQLESALTDNPSVKSEVWKKFVFVWVLEIEIVKA